MTLLEKYKKDIEEISSKELNQDQKDLAFKILEKFQDNELEYVFQFIAQRIKTGFRFDVAPENDSQTIALLKKDEQKSFVLDENKSKENTLIIGENYDALKNLLLIERERERAGQEYNYDLIYIDPPYNTEATKNDGNSVANDKENINSNKFIYRDKYSRNGWLNFMNERLRLAKKLLKDDGVIFVSIDDSEQAYLKVLMDEIFGEENFVANSIWFSISSVLKQSKLIRKEHEYICIYAKNISLLEFNKQENTAVFLNPDNDPNGEWLSSNAASPNQKSNKNKFQIKLPNGNYCERNWKFTFDDYINNRVSLYFKGNNVPRLKIYKKDYELFSKVQSSIFKDKGSITSAKKEIISIIEKDIFSTPKPLPLLKSIISFLTKNARILDFFAGSGTTGHAVLELNKEDGGNRTFTLVTNNENNIGINVNYERLYRINHGFGTKNESFDWSKKNEPYKANLNVYSMDYIDISPFSNVDTKEIIKELIKVLNDFGVNNLDQENDFDIKELLNSLLSLKPQVKQQSE